jgi:hypothetical protein
MDEADAVSAGKDGVQQQTISVPETEGRPPPVIINVTKLIKLKLSLCFSRAPRHEGVLGEWRYAPLIF